MMNDNKALVRRYIESQMNTGREGGGRADFVATDLVRRTCGIGLNLTLAGPPEISIEEQVAEGEKVMTRFTTRGIYGGGLERWGVPASAVGQPARWTVTATHRIVDGRIVEEWTQPSYLGLLQDLGAFPVSV